ncbi:MAG: hypothetical protein ACO3XO_07100 [Bdellovibrionota bacterium]
MEKRDQERVALISKGAKEITKTITKTECRDGKSSPIKFVLTSLFLIAPATGWTAPQLPQCPPPVTSPIEVRFDVERNSSIETEDDRRIDAAKATPVEQLVIVTEVDAPSSAVWAGYVVNPEAPGVLEQYINCRTVGQTVGLVPRSESISGEDLVDCTLSLQ